MEVDLDMKYDNLLENVHFGLKNPTEDGKSYFVKGLYSYFHYNCDGFKDSVSNLFLETQLSVITRLSDFR